ncbi:MAG TPA: ATP synthase subunit I [Candidatus Aquilonibacter sp.]|nr:ATP synthase subunit I [Candidatus Aquilonibacter sp.]
MSAEGTEYGAFDRRIEALIPFIGGATAIAALIGWGWRAGLGAAAGAALCWLNFRYLRQGAEGVIKLGLAQAGAERVHVPRSTYLKFYGRLGLLMLAVYAILVWLRLPAVAVVCGLTAFFPAIIFAAGYEALCGRQRETRNIDSSKTY